ncbi:MAG: desulfoferrodoxin FeS4 iron-binding domain-containing protein [Atribacterota bacterium]
MARVEKVGEIFRCERCGNVVEVREVGEGELVCCGQPMSKVETKKGGRRRCGQKSA